MKITERQLRRIIREEMKSKKSSRLLTEAELQEIAPVIAATVKAIAGVGARILPKALPYLKKGGTEAAKYLLKNPEMLDGAVELVKKAASKIPGIDVSDKASLEKALKGDAAEKIGDIIGQAAPEMEKVQESIESRKMIRKMIREERSKIMREEEDMSMYDDITKAPLNLPPRPDKPSKAQANIVTDMEVPVKLFDEMVEFLEDISDSGTQSGGFGKRARELLLKMERELGIL